MGLIASGPGLCMLFTKSVRNTEHYYVPEQCEQGTSTSMTLCPRMGSILVRPGYHSSMRLSMWSTI